MKQPEYSVSSPLGAAHIQLDVILINTRHLHFDFEASLIVVMGNTGAWGYSPIKNKNEESKFEGEIAKLV